MMASVSVSVLNSHPEKRHKPADHAAEQHVGIAVDLLSGGCRFWQPVLQRYCIRPDCRLFDMYAFESEVLFRSGELGLPDSRI